MQERASLELSVTHRSEAKGTLMATGFACLLGLLSGYLFIPLFQLLSALWIWLERSYFSRTPRRTLGLGRELAAEVVSLMGALGLTVVPFTLYFRAYSTGRLASFLWVGAFIVGYCLFRFNQARRVRTSAKVIPVGASEITEDGCVAIDTFRWFYFFERNLIRMEEGRTLTVRISDLGGDAAASIEERQGTLTYNPRLARWELRLSRAPLQAVNNPPLRLAARNRL